MKKNKNFSERNKMKYKSEWHLQALNIGGENELMIKYEDRIKIKNKDREEKNQKGEIWKTEEQNRCSDKRSGQLC